MKTRVIRYFLQFKTWKSKVLKSSPRNSDTSELSRFLHVTDSLSCRPWSSLITVDLHSVIICIFILMIFPFVLVLHPIFIHNASNCLIIFTIVSKETKLLEIIIILNISNNKLPTLKVSTVWSKLFQKETQDI